MEREMGEMEGRLISSQEKIRSFSEIIVSKIDMMY